MFLFGGVLTLAMVLVAIAFIPESLKYLFERRPDDALARVNKILRKLRKPTLAELPEVVTESAGESKGFIDTMMSLLTMQHRRNTIILWIAFFFCFSALYFLISWVPKLMENSGYSAEVGRRAFFLMNLGAVLGIYVLGTLSTRWHLSNVVSFFLSASAVFMVIFAAAPNQLNVLLVVTFLIGFLQQGGFTGLYAIAAKSYPTEIRTTGIGWAIGLGRFGAVAGPAIAGFLIASGLGMSGNYYVFAVPMAIGGLLAYFMKTR